MGEIQLHIYFKLLAPIAGILAEVIVNNNSAVAIVFKNNAVAVFCKKKVFFQYERNE